MTMRRSRRPRPQVHRKYTSGSATATSVGIANTALDVTPQNEISAGADPQTGEVLVTGIGTSSAGRAISRLYLYVGRTSTSPAEDDAKVRTRDFPSNAEGIPFVIRIKGLTLREGDFIKLKSFVVVESDAGATHTHTVTCKWAYHEMR